MRILQKNYFFYRISSLFPKACMFVREKLSWKLSLQGHFENDTRTSRIRGKMRGENFGGCFSERERESFYSLHVPLFTRCYVCYISSQHENSHASFFIVQEQQLITVFVHKNFPRVQ